MRPVLVLVCLLGLSLGAVLEREKKPHHCKSPPLLTGAFTFTSQNEKAFFYAPYEYDAIGERIRLYEVGTYQNQSFTLDILMLFRERVMYQIDDKAKKCVKQPLTADFQPMGVPPNATLWGQNVIGSSSGPGEGLLVNTWTGQAPDGMIYVMTVTEFGCIPVSLLYQSKDFGWVAVSYLNNVEGLVDPSALVPPDFCLNQEVQVVEQPVDFFTVIENIRKNAR